jgi:hypothetical protein
MLTTTQDSVSAPMAGADWLVTSIVEIVILSASTIMAVEDQALRTVIPVPRMRTGDTQMITTTSWNARVSQTTKESTVSTMWVHVIQSVTQQTPHH